MISIITFIIGILFTILFIIGTHEYAHFIVARMLNINVLQFSIGFGKKLFSWRGKNGTEYVFALIPLGGYVKMLDENEGMVSKEQLPFAFNRQPIYKKFLVVLAGPAMNLFCAFILYWLIFTIGFTTVKPVIGSIIPHSIAATSKINPNDEIMTIDGKPTPTWSSVILRLIAHIGNNDAAKMEVKNIYSKKISTYSLNLSHWHMDELSPDPLSSIGIMPYQPFIPLIIDEIAPNSPAVKSPLQIGDQIIAINHKTIKTWNELSSIISHNPSQLLFFTIERKSKRLDVPVIIGYQRNITLDKTGYLGIAPKFDMPKIQLRHIQYSFFEAAPRALQEITDFVYFNVMLFGKLLTGKLSLKSLGGPITIFETAGTALNYGFISFTVFLAFMSISIGIINLLPIPGLDGGHLLMHIIESITRRPIPENVLLLLYRLGFIFIFVIIVQALVNDIARLFH